MKTVKVSVTALADFACRVGDLELSGPIGPSAREGIKAHQRIQKSRPEQTEVRIFTKYTLDDTEIQLSGRIDLLDSAQHRLSEIKTTLVPAHRVTQSQQALHWAQLMLYAFCYWHERRLQNELEPQFKTILLELLYVNIRASDETSLKRDVSFTELKQFAEEAFSRYVRWQKIIDKWYADTVNSAAALVFPHTEFRSGQRDMAAAIFRTVRDSGSLLCEAPTGTGKTISSLFPVVKSIADKSVTRAVYLTAKTSGRASAMHALKLLEDKGLKTTAVVIRSKQLTCFCSNGRCQRDDRGVCPMTLGFFDRLPDAREEALEMGIVDGDRIDAIAWAHQLCPFEFALQLLPWVTFVVCDFNYVFDPLVRLGRFAESRRDTALLVDEIHNLVDRAREMHSARLYRSDMLAAASEFKSSYPALSLLCERVARQLLAISKGLDKGLDVEVLHDVPSKLKQAAYELMQGLLNASDQGVPPNETGSELFKTVCRFVVISELYSDDHRTLVERHKRQTTKEVVLQLKCLNATPYLAPQYRIFHSTVGYSATLRPVAFYRDTLGFPEHTQQLILQSPFDPRKVQHSLVTYINTRYRLRQASVNQIVELLNSMISCKRGNYMIFFPSYSYMEEVHMAFLKQKIDVEVWCQSRQSSIQEREALLKRLATPGHRLGFAILGGVYGEGVDYVGDLLIGLVLIGTGLPGNVVEQDLIAEVYQKKGLDGYDYAYRYPGFSRVLQTAGRLIRSANDSGVIIMVDDRFVQPFYRDLFPKHWHVDMANSAQVLDLHLQKFWSEYKNES